MLPDRKILVHKAIEPSKLTAKTRAALDIPDDLRLSLHDWQIEEKLDGCHMIAVGYDDGTVGLFSRSGEPVRSCLHIAGALRGHIRGKVLFGEVWKPDTEHRAINGAFRRHETQEDLRYYVFDMVPLDDFYAGYCDDPHSLRYERLISKLAYIDRPDVLGIPLAQQVPDPLTVAGCLANNAHSAYDGLVAKRRDMPWVAGAGRGGAVIKIKASVSLDLEVIGIEEGLGKHAGRMGALVLRYKDGKELRVGTGFSDFQREEYWAARNVPGEIIGRIVEIVGLGDSKKGSIREPRFISIRHDKETGPDY